MGFISLIIILGTLIASVIAQQQCVPYTSNYTFTTGYPPIWVTPGAETFTTPEYQQLNKSFNWAMVPNIPPNKLVNGALDLSTYSASDPNCWWSFKNCVNPKAPGLNPDISFCPEPGSWGLTYDDGPNCSHTEFYDFLKGQNQRATMYFIGSNVADWTNEAKRAYADGHQICVHTWSHPYMTTLTNDQVLAELYYTRKAIKYVIGVTPRCWRPPFGDVDDRVRAIAQLLGMSTDIWNLDSNDWKMIPAGTSTPAQVDSIFEGFVQMGKNGTFATSGVITLQHELNNGTMSKAQQWYPQIKGAFKHLVPVASCMNITHPYAETDITYPSFSEIVGSGSTSGTGTNNPSSSGGSGPNSTHKSSSVSMTSCISLISMVAIMLIAQLSSTLF
ncbi:40297_t:CDS:2 [Gigaspora margarita]|uniref:40297_t:CDS:1 n=1 Tax=Gigaspora margarita TaxID=4874 RepID=A0ABN7V6H8_GIGMA|nr:40297_t:CDS:2 [Gigaspora margarita]